MGIAVVDSLPVRHRPKNLNGIIGQDFAVSVIEGALKEDKMPRSIILTGPPGTGKTTIGRLVNNYVNCQKRKSRSSIICLSSPKRIKSGELCESCKMALTGGHPDLHEINGANARKIEDVRAIINFASSMPTFNNRVFLIDEIQQFTDPSIQAILKPLEEPPANTMWVLATMEPDKIPEAVYSRCTHIVMTPLEKKPMAKLLTRIAKKEGYTLGDEAISWISSMSGLRPRDALSLLDALLHHLAAKGEKELNSIGEDISEVLIKSGVLGTGPIALVILALLYVRSPVVFAFLQHGVTDQLLRDLYYFQDNFIAHAAYGNKNWRWKTALKAVKSVLKNEIKFNAYSLPIKYHIALNALLGEALLNGRRFGDPGVALRKACSDWWLLDIKENGSGIEIDEE